MDRQGTSDDGIASRNTARGSGFHRELLCERGCSGTLSRLTCTSTKSPSKMRYRSFPGTEIRVSEIGFGTWTLSTGWWGEKTDDEAVEMLRTAQRDYGINFFDTADTYGNGRGESQLARAFRGMRDR